MRRNHEPNQGPGQDSFLDIVANLVGVLIILVVVIGAQAGQSMLESKEQEKKNDIARATEQLEKAQLGFNVALQSQRDLEMQIANENQKSQLENKQRNRAIIELADINRRIEQEKSTLRDHEVAAIEKQQKVLRLKQQLTSIRQQTQSLSQLKPKAKSIDHIPTPIAKTVFNDEVHFRLLNQRLVTVPMDELIELMRGEWELKARALNPNSSTVEMVGPIGGFRMQYILQSFNQRMNTPYGPVDQQVRQFRRFILVPENDRLGVDFDSAMKPDSNFHATIARLDPGQHTISVWVYPDSYAEYHQLKKFLYERGFQVACWPMSKGRPIAGGPDGHRSTAQ